MVVDNLQLTPDGRLMDKKSDASNENAQSKSSINNTVDNESKQILDSISEYIDKVNSREELERVYRVYLGQSSKLTPEHTNTLKNALQSKADEIKQLEAHRAALAEESRKAEEGSELTTSFNTKVHNIRVSVNDEMDKAASDANYKVPYIVLSKGDIGENDDIVIDLDVMMSWGNYNNIFSRITQDEWGKHLVLLSELNINKLTIMVNGVYNDRSRVEQYIHLKIVKCNINKLELVYSGKGNFKHAVISHSCYTYDDSRCGIDIEQSTINELTSDFIECPVKFTRSIIADYRNNYNKERAEIPNLCMRRCNIKTVRLEGVYYGRGERKNAFINSSIDDFQLIAYRDSSNKDTDELQLYMPNIIKRLKIRSLDIKRLLIQSDNEYLYGTAKLKDIIATISDPKFSVIDINNADEGILDIHYCQDMEIDGNCEQVEAVNLIYVGKLTLPQSALFTVNHLFLTGTNEFKHRRIHSCGYGLSFLTDEPSLVMASEIKLLSSKANIAYRGNGVVQIGKLLLFHSHKYNYRHKNRLMELTNNWVFKTYYGTKAYDYLIGNNIPFEIIDPENIPNDMQILQSKAAMLGTNLLNDATDNAINAAKVENTALMDHDIGGTTHDVPEEIISLYGLNAVNEKEGQFTPSELFAISYYKSIPFNLFPITSNALDLVKSKKAVVNTVSSYARGGLRIYTLEVRLIALNKCDNYVVVMNGKELVHITYIADYLTTIKKESYSNTDFYGWSKYAKLSYENLKQIDELDLQHQSMKQRKWKVLGGPGGTKDYIVNQFSVLNNTFLGLACDSGLRAIKILDDVYEYRMYWAVGRSGQRNYNKMRMIGVNTSEIINDISEKYKNSITKYIEENLELVMKSGSDNSTNTESIDPAYSSPLWQLVELLPTDAKCFKDKGTVSDEFILALCSIQGIFNEIDERTFELAYKDSPSEVMVINTESGARFVSYNKNTKSKRYTGEYMHSATNVWEYSSDYGESRYFASRCSGSSLCSWIYRLYTNKNITLCDLNGDRNYSSNVMSSEVVVLVKTRPWRYNYSRVSSGFKLYVAIDPSNGVGYLMMALRNLPNYSLPLMRLKSWGSVLKYANQLEFEEEVKKNLDIIRKFSEVRMPDHPNYKDHLQSELSKEDRYRGLYEAVIRNIKTFDEGNILKNLNISGVASDWKADIGYLPDKPIIEPMYDLREFIESDEIDLGTDSIEDLDLGIKDLDNFDLDLLQAAIAKGFFTVITSIPGAYKPNYILMCGEDHIIEYYNSSAERYAYDIDGLMVESEYSLSDLFE